MPDDSKEYQAAQRKHDGFVEFTRKLSQVTGVPVGRVRSQVRRAQKAIGGNAAAGPQSPPVSQNLKPLPGPSTSAKLEPKPFNPVPVFPRPDAAGGDGGAQGELLEDVVYLDTGDQTFYYTNVYTDGRKDPV